MMRGYKEEELVQNRVSLLLFGGSEEERRAWAEEAATNFPLEGALRVARTAEEIDAGLRPGKGVLYVANVDQLGRDAQVHLLRCLQSQEERPKLVLGLSVSPDDAIASGKLREDLAYRLRTARVDLSAPGASDVIRARRARTQETLAKAKQLVRVTPITSAPRSGSKKRSAKSAPAKKKAKPSTPKKAAGGRKR